MGIPTILIYDGKIQYDNLSILGYDSKWLEERINEQGFIQAKDIFLALLEADGTLHINIS